MKQVNHYQGDVVALVRRLFAAEDDVLAGARARAEAAGMPLIEVAPEDGALLALLVSLVRPQRVVEIGTLFGYSAIWMARALPSGGQLVTVEADPEHAAIAADNIAAAGVADRVRIVVGPAPASLQEIDDPVDLVFVDADKPAYPDYLAWARERLRPGGVLLADNAFQNGSVVEPGDDGARAVRAMLESLATDAAWDAAIIPTLEGMAIAIRTR